MALLRIGGLNPEKRRDELLSNYESEEPYMPGGYETPYNGEEPWLPTEYDDEYDDEYDEYGDEYGDDYAYGDGGRYDDDYGYDEQYGYEDDDYPPEDGDYDRGPYYDAPGYVPEREYPAGGAGELLRYLDEHDWVTWLLLILLPPVGIWLLWRRRRYSQGVNVALTAVSLLWLAAVLFVLIAKPFQPKGDTTITPQPVGAAAVTAANEAEAPEEEAEPEAETASTELISVEEVDEANAVYTVSGAPFYHQDAACQAIGEGVETTKTSRNAAIEQSLMACPYCIGSQYSDGMWDMPFVNAETEDKSNMKVYCSAYNAHFHIKDSCSDIGGDAHEVGLKEALLMAKTPCEVCCPTAAQQFYCTADGTYYHAKDDCSGMRNASQVTYAEVRVLGKKRCPVCIGGEDETEVAQEDDAVAQAAGYYVYATPKGAYYHVNSTCSGMKNAQQVLLSDMLKQNRPACPVCCPDAETTVFAEAGNPYYHSNATCSGMTNAKQGILVNALAAGLTRCPECWTSTNEDGGSGGEG